MARYIGPTCKLARREGADLSLKSPARALDSKCKLEQKPGQHGAAKKGKMSDYAVQLREKQKVKRYYGLVEKQFRLTFERAERMKGVTGENLLSLLERRLDNVVHRLGFAASRAQARQLIRHGHVVVNGRKVNVPSLTLPPGAVVGIKEKSRQNPLITAAVETAKGRGVPAWLELAAAEFQGKVVSAPRREDVSLQVSEKLIVELYSK